jgi:hypothetical protein
MSELFPLLERHAVSLTPRPDALDGIMRGVRRRRITRRLASAGAALAVLAGGMAVVPLLQRHLPTPTISTVMPPEDQALALRTRLGIRGATKGAPGSVVVRERHATGGSQLSLVQVLTGKTVPLPGRMKDATLSPDGGAVAAVTDDHLVVGSTQTGETAPVTSETARVEGRLSWDQSSGSLFTRLNGRWVLVHNPAWTRGPHGRPTPAVQDLNVPTIPGGPILLSVSPDGDLALLFGLTWRAHLGPKPHLFLGRFDGVSVTEQRKVDVPPGALDGPMGWLGENAFLLAPADGEALIVRTDGPRLLVRADSMADPCGLVASAAVCTPVGPALLGTDAKGSLLFWKLSAEEGIRQPTPVVLYYKTWLDGSHAVRLVGLAGVFGPAVAAR